MKKVQSLLNNQKLQKVLIAAFWFLMFVADYAITPIYNLNTLQGEDDDNDSEFDNERRNNKDRWDTYPKGRSGT